MTLQIKSFKTDKWYISMDYEKEGVIVVQACPIYGDLIGYPHAKMTYPLNDRKNANATYRRYIKRYAD